MAGMFERLGSMASTDVGKALTLAHTTYTARMQEHSHSGRAILETIAHVAKEHPAVFGIGALFLLEVIAAEQHHLHETHAAAAPHPGNGTAAVPAEGGGLHLPHLELPHLDLPNLHVPTLRVDHIRPGKVAMEVFGALLLLKFATFGARMFRRKSHTDVWFAPASRIHLFSGAIGAYYVAKAVRSPKVSAWRNAAAALFVTDALKPMLKAPKRRKGAPAPAARSTNPAPAARVASPLATGPVPTTPAPLAPVSGPDGPSGGMPSPAPSPEPAGPTVSGPANDPATASIQVTPGQVFAASPQFWTPPPRPNRDVVTPQRSEPESAAVHLTPIDGPEHVAPAASAGQPAPQMASRPADLSGGIPSGEIIQWTGFSGAAETASRLAD